MNAICPLCNQPLPGIAGKRVCADCGAHIKSRHKWYVGGDGKLHHRVCGRPESYGASQDAPQTMELIPETFRPDITLNRPGAPGTTSPEEAIDGF